MGTVSLGYRTDLMLLGLQGSVIEQWAGYQVIRTPANPTFHWGNFLLLDRPPAPGTVSSWMSTFAREFPGAEHVAIGVDGSGGVAGDEAELATAGLEADRSTVLTAAAATPPPRPNEAAQFRMLDSDADWDSALGLQEAAHPYGEPERTWPRRRRSSLRTRPGRRSGSIGRFPRYRDPGPAAAPAARLRTPDSRAAA